jgi:hypothetical protein
MAEPLETTIATSLRLSQALELARHGKLREAQQLLAAAGTLPEDPLELHALAALATGEGDNPRALRLWRLLLQREPGHAEAKRMIGCIELWLSRPPWFSYIPIGLVALGIGIVVSIVMLALSSPEPAPALVERPAVAPAAYAPAPTAPITINMPAMNAPADARRRRPSR